ncbi:MAG TPA: pyridoxamine 5'-phosphate oxidase family protein [Smithellaceae bacterium]|nr:pyridoxamine 5'-phosphate oxidase family protein [Smithellaceae bacterium]
MRRPEKEINDLREILTILEQACVCRIAFCDNNKPYIVPVNFAVRKNNLYFHCAKAGRKIDILKKNAQICFEVDSGTEIVTGESPCAWGMKYRSVIGFGRASFITDSAGKKAALDIIMEKYAGAGNFSYKEEALSKVLVISVAIESMTGKKSVVS